MIQLDLEDRTPKELNALMDSVKVSNLPVSEKDFHINRIKERLGTVTRDPIKEKRILAEMQAGMADINDIGN